MVTHLLAFFSGFVFGIGLIVGVVLYIAGKINAAVVQHERKIKEASDLLLEELKKQANERRTNKKARS